MEIFRECMEQPFSGCDESLRSDIAAWADEYKNRGCDGDTIKYGEGKENVTHPT